MTAAIELVEGPLLDHAAAALGLAEWPEGTDDAQDLWERARGVPAPWTLRDLEGTLGPYGGWSPARLRRSSPRREKPIGEGTGPLRKHRCESSPTGPPAVPVEAEEPPRGPDPRGLVVDPARASAAPATPDDAPTRRPEAHPHEGPFRVIAEAAARKEGEVARLERPGPVEPVGDACAESP